MSKTFAPIYTTYDSVKVRLANKVQFETEELLDGQMPNALLGQIIVDAETSVEQELRGRYAVPFQGKSGEKFDRLPDHSQRTIRQLVDLKAVMFILATDFGRGTHVSGSSYAKDTENTYKKQLRLALGQDLEGEEFGEKRFRRTPPLEGMRLSASNKEADDGYKGKIINTDSHRDSATYAEEQINNPSRSYLDTLGIRRTGRR